MAKSSWEKSHWIESRYHGQVSRVAREVDRIISGYDTSTAQGRIKLQQALNSYADLLEPWVVTEAGKVFDSLNRQDKAMWFKSSEKIGSGLRKVINETPIGDTAREFIRDQVELIKSLPIDAGLRAQEIAREAIITGARPEEIMAEINNLGAITKNRARLIARTECSKASSALTQTRGKRVGATHAIWRTMKDAAVRHSHEEMEGTTYSLSEAPLIPSENKRYFPGQFPNCRCFPEIIIPDFTL